jgi:hypothetical protein
VTSRRSIVDLMRWVAGWVIPHRTYLALRQWLSRSSADRQNPSPELKLVMRNRALRNAHWGERCFVLCNAPSVLKQDLRHLEGEAVISVSSGYHHPLFGRIQPRYHCLPQLTYGVLTEDDAVTWFREMHAGLGNAELFLSCTEEQLVRRHGLFAGRTVRYVHFSQDMDQIAGREIPNLAGPVPCVQSVSIMCLMVAMYMGFRNIYLLGVDHDHFKTGEYRYFYSPTVLSGKDHAVNTDGRVLSSRYDEFQVLARLWRQYRHMHEVASANGVAIFNATAGGELDEFRRVEFKSLFASA